MQSKYEIHNPKSIYFYVIVVEWIDVFLACEYKDTVV